MTESISLSVGSLVENKKTEKRYRVICFDEKSMILCDLSTSAISLGYESTDELLKKISDGKWAIVTENDPVFSITTLDSKNLDIYKRNKNIVDAVAEEYGPTYLELQTKKPKPLIKQLQAEYGISKATLWRIIAKWLQSGFKDAVLVNYADRKIRKPIKRTKQVGKPSSSGITSKLLDESDLDNFDKAIAMYKKSQRASFRDAYNVLIHDHYSKTTVNGGTITREPFPQSERPSYEQFYYYCRKTLTPEEKKRAKHKSQNFFNNERALIGSVNTDVRGPGDIVEMDANEMDIALVDENDPEQAVGRPILYIMIDVYSRMILAISVAVDNNSVVGFTNCLLTLVQDKKDLLSRTNVMNAIPADGNMTIDDLWPSNVRPATLCFDRGSDFISNEASRIAKELNITLDIVPPGTGSMKPVVERIFGQIENDFRQQLEHKGLITKDHGSKHHQEAVLTMKEAQAIVLNSVVKHNTHYMKSYPKSPEMIRKGIKPIPYVLWKYGCQTAYNPKSLPSRNQFLYAVMTPVTATVSRRGIRCLGMHYQNIEDDDLKQTMIRQQTKEKPFTARMDQRDVGHLYYLKNGKLMMASLEPLNPQYKGYYGMSINQFKELKKKAAKMDAEGEIYNTDQAVAIRTANQSIIDSAEVQHPGKKNTKNMKESRAKVKQQVNDEHAIANRFGLAANEKEQSPVPQPAEEVSKEKAEAIPVETISTDASPEDIAEMLARNAQRMAELEDERTNGKK